MDDRARICMSSFIGAVAGAAYGFLYLTERGRRVRLEIEPRLDNFVHEVQRLRGTVRKAQFAVNESRQSLYEITGRG
ncbi:MAG: YtxH domain-containing protein [Vicinamibacterales bacterium]